MAAPTAIPHAENSSHQQQQHHARSNSPPLISPPVYSRTAFSLPGGPIVSPSTSSSFRNTANGWTTTGVGSSSPPRGAQRDKFPERRPSNATANNNTPSIARHSRAFSTSSATSANSLSSSASSIDSFGGPHTPRQSTNGSTDTGSIAASLGGAPLGRVPSIPLATSPYEAIKTGRRDSWATPTSPPQQSTWGGFNTLRSGRSPPAHQDSFGSGNDLFRTKSRDSAQQQQASATTSAASGGMTGLFRKLSMGTASRPSAQPQSSQSHTHHHGHHHHGHRSASISAVETPTITTTSPAPATTSAADAPPSPTRGRQASLSAGGAGGGTRRRPSPHGERLLMGWTHAH